MTTAALKKEPLKTASLAAIAAVMAVIAPAPSAVAQNFNEQAAEAGYGAPVLGPKKSVAVVDFGANGAFLAQYGGWDAGGGLAAMLETELGSTGRFRVANRSHLDAALYEQQLSENGLTAVRTAQAGQLVGAQYLVRASVTDFTLAEKGGGHFHRRQYWRRPWGHFPALAHRPRRHRLPGYGLNQRRSRRQLYGQPQS